MVIKKNRDQIWRNNKLKGNFEVLKGIEIKKEKKEEKKKEKIISAKSEVH